MACGLEIRNTGRSAGSAPKPAASCQSVATMHAVALTINKAF